LHPVEVCLQGTRKTARANKLILIKGLKDLLDTEAITSGAYEKKVEEILGHL
jgi:hypothetical protein